MSKNVYANGREVSANADDNESLAAMPDVCLSPPSPPAGPIPIPYPNFSEAKDTTEGTSSVEVGGKKVGQKEKSYYKKSKGNEAATKTLGMGIVSHCIQGATVFAAWSMDVKAENENVIRFLDLTTHNHMVGTVVKPANPPSVTASTGGVVPPPSDPDCVALKIERDDEDDRIKEDIGGKKTQRKPKESTKRYKRRAAKKKQDAMDAHKATTVSASKAKCGSKTIQKNAYSSHSNLSAKNQRRLSGGIKPGQKSNMCKKNGKSYKHTKQGYKSSCSHTEGKFIEDLFQKPPGGFANDEGRVNCTMTISIKWKQRAKDAKGQWRELPPKEVPCKACEKTICHAIHCGLKISLCKTQPDKSVQKEKPDFC
jgi:hypothetical protein